ncbi:shikimate dehydrogenase [Ideonella livida]|uniref:Shikimate dehydrogenase (NADP(+)) n=1 Tax=Ideonella livida TaxID=2707176 RepID=A0A7C9TIG5_9BURK|nr:shikimate dehydrogenase [Ideonella livida]NDY91220.1 shikimate dehydrogenase [Ideonella livida]
MTDRYAVIGHPIGHSKSPLIHGLFAQACGHTLRYEALEGPLTPADGFERLVHDFRAQGGLGLNITAPFKLRAFALADERSERATLAGAANALKFEGGRILAENFDGIGLRRDIEVNLQCPLAGRRVLLLGAGGAARGALLPFLHAGPAELVLTNRDEAKAQALVAELAGRGPLRSRPYAALAAEGRFDLVVNATSASLSGQLPPVPASVFSPTGTAYELAYGKGLTPFLKLARQAGVRGVADGVGMLVEQAAEAFAWWRGVRPATTAVIDRLTVPLE